LLLEKWRSITRKVMLPALLGIAAVAALSWGIYQNQMRSDYEAQLKNVYTRSFYELVDSMGSVQDQLSKLMVSNSPGGNIQLLADISRQAANASEKISQLPLSHPALSDTMGLISLTGDYCRSLTNKAADGHPLTSQDIEHLKSLYNSCLTVTDELKKMQSEGQVSFANINNKTYYDVSKTDEISSQFSEQEKGGMDYPTMIYDGPFSESITNAQPKGLPQGDVDENGAKQAAATFLGLANTTGVTLTGTCKGKIDTYMIEATDTAGQKVTVQVSKQGGKVLQMIEESGAAQPSISVDDCVSKASAWLATVGLQGMVATFKQQYDGLVVINFAAQQDGAVLYTDLVKVKIRMDDGRIAAFDATGYWMNHTARQTLTPIITQADAQKLVSTQLTVAGSQLALIPMSGGGERLCWEYRGTFGGDTFYVYIDAVTGEEAGVFKVINTDNGSLVV
jgi:spore germination protein